MIAANRIVFTLAQISVVLCVLGALSSGLGVRFELWDFSAGFTILRWSVYLLAIPVILCLINMALAKVNNTSIFTLRHALILLVSAVILVIPYQAREAFREHPTIADATTDIDTPPKFVALVSEREKTAKNPLEYRGGEATERQLTYFPELVSATVPQSVADVIERLEHASVSAGWIVAEANQDEGRLEATETTFWFRFKDDVVVRARALKDGHTMVDIRSASRVGYLDGGANAKRVAMLLAALKVRKTA